MNNIENIENSQFGNAVALIRHGYVDEGLQALDLIEGNEVMKNLVKAEIAYWRSDFKNAMFFDEHSLTSDHLWYDQFVVVHHLRAYVMAARKIGAISRAKCFLEYYIDQKRKQFDLVGARPYNKIFQNAMRRLDDQEAKDEPPSVKIIDGDEDSCQIQMYSMSGPITPGKEAAIPISLMLEVSWNHVPTRVILKLYEQYAEYITSETHHIMAARNYILLQEHDNALTCLRRLVANWRPVENFQVMPMRPFVYPDIMEYIYANHLENEFLTSPKQQNGSESADSI